MAEASSAGTSATSRHDRATARSLFGNGGAETSFVCRTTPCAICTPHEAQLHDDCAATGWRSSTTCTDGTNETFTQNQACLPNGDAPGGVGAFVRFEGGVVGALVVAGLVMTWRKRIHHNALMRRITRQITGAVQTV